MGKTREIFICLACALFFISLADIWAAETKPKPNAVGDVVLNNGTAVAFENISQMDDAQKAKAMAVIFYIGKECSNNGKTRVLGVGLFHDRGFSWNKNSAETKRGASLDTSPEIDTIKCEVSAKIKEKESKGNKLFSVTTNLQYDTGSYVFEGDKDGSDNLEQISAFLKNKGLPDDTAPIQGASVEEQNYPAFYFAKNYKDYKRTISEKTSSSPLGKIIGKENYQTKEISSNVSDEFKDGWYLPSIVELFHIWKNLDKVDEASAACGGDQFKPELTSSQTKNNSKLRRSSPYWSSSQYEIIKIDGDTTNYKSLGGVGYLAYTLDIISGNCESNVKSSSHGGVCAIREF